MTNYSIVFYSKNKKSLNNFLKFLEHDLKIQQIQKSTKYIRRKTTKKRITVLKSPHVNKSAQEQFEYRVYSLGISFYSSRVKKNLVLLKKVKNQLFPDIKIKVKSILKIKQNSVKKVSLSPGSFTFNLSRFNITNQRLSPRHVRENVNLSKSKNLLKRTSYYLYLLDCYGM